MTNEPQDIASLIADLNDADKKVIRRAADALIAMAPDHPELLRKLNDLLTQTSEEKCWPMAYILAQFTKPSSLCLDVLAQNLDNHDPDTRWAAAQLLVHLGKDDSRIAALLQKLVETGSPLQRRMALYALRDLDLRDPASLQALMKALADSDSLVRVAAVTGVKSRSDLSHEQVELLLHLFLEDPDSRVRHNAAIALAQTGGAYTEIEAALKQASQSDNIQLKKAATAALALIKKKSPSTPQETRRRTGSR